MQTPATTSDLSAYTTLRLGGPARRMIDAASDDALVDAVTQADASGEPVLLLGGGSNLVIADEGFAGTVVRVLTRGIRTVDRGDGSSELVVAAGEPWDDVVAHAAAARLRGIECLSGIPGSTGATPIQNVGAYGAAIADVLTRVRAWDRVEQRHVELSASECGFGYRTSRFRHADRFVILEVAMRLEHAGDSAPIRYAELARRLGVGEGERAPLGEVRDVVLELRRGKGMVLDPDLPDSVSAGSFFTNPILEGSAFEAFGKRVRERLGVDARPPSWPEPDGRVKTSAAWLIERAGFERGFGEGRVGLSTRHTLALVNRGGASTAELLMLARTIRDGVRDAFGVELHPEPTLVGVEL